MKCTYCTQEITRKIKPDKLKRNKRFFCNRKCFYGWSAINLPKHRVSRPRYPRVERTCMYCEKIFYVKRDVPNNNRGKFCSRSCKGRYSSKEKHSCWKGGISSERDQAKTTQEYKDWRANVYRRDYWTCQLCDKKGGAIDAHHIKRFSLYPDLRSDVNNGITLCRQCHRMVNGQEEKFEDYLSMLILSVETKRWTSGKPEELIVRSVQECTEVDRNDLPL